MVCWLVVSGSACRAVSRVSRLAVVLLVSACSSVGVWRETASLASMLVMDTGVNHGRVELAMSQQGLDGGDVATGIDQLGGEGVSRMCSMSFMFPVRQRL